MPLQTSNAFFFDWTNENGEVSYKETEVHSKRIFYIFMKNINNLIILQKKRVP